MIEDALDSVKTTSYQIHSFSHVSEDLAQFVDVLRAWTEKVEEFFSDPRRTGLVAAGIIVLVVISSYVRARLALLSRRLKKRFSII
jgi:hypothetical protein